MERDINRIRLVGTLAFALGIAQSLLTILTCLLVLASSLPSGPGALFQGALAFGLSMIMASCLVACGHELQQIRTHSSSAIADIRWLWTALFLTMIVGFIGGNWLAPPLSVVAAIMLIALMLIRGSVIQLSR